MDLLNSLWESIKKDRRKVIPVVLGLATIIPCLLAVCAFLGISQLGDLVPGRFGGPSESEVRELVLPDYPSDVFGGSLRDYRLISKRRCEEISVTADARGITEAWIIEYYYERWNETFKEWNELNHASIIVKKDGDWEEYGIGAVGCP